MICDVGINASPASLSLSMPERVAFDPKAWRMLIRPSFDERETDCARESVYKKKIIWVYVAVDV